MDRLDRSDSSSQERVSRRAFLTRRRPRPLDRAQLSALAVPEEERMMGWMSLRRQLLEGLSQADPARLERYLSLSCRRELELERLYGSVLPDERPAMTLVAQEHPGEGFALYTVRERTPTKLAEALFGAGQALEVDLQVTSGRDWLVRALRPAVS